MSKLILMCPFKLALLYQQMVTKHASEQSEGECVAAVVRKKMCISDKCCSFCKIGFNIVLITHMIWQILGDGKPALPCHVILGQHTVDRHHVQSISVLPACLQKPLLLQTTHIKTLYTWVFFKKKKNKKLTKGTTSNRSSWLWLCAKDPSNKTKPLNLKQSSKELFVLFLVLAVKYRVERCRLPGSPETGRPPLLPGCTGDAAGSRSSPARIDRSCSPGHTHQSYIIKSQLKQHSSTIQVPFLVQVADNQMSNFISSVFYIQDKF